MPIKTVRAHPEIIRRVGLGAQQCAECGAVYRDTAIPETCDNGECPTNRSSVTDDILHAASHRYHLTEEQGNVVRQELLAHRTCLRITATKADVEYVEQLIKLFD